MGPSDDGSLKTWHNTLILDNLESFRKSHADCCVLGKPTVRTDEGYQAFSLIRSIDRNRSVCTMFTNGEYLTGEGCPAGMVTLHVRANGDVSLCDFTPHSFANVRERPLHEIRSQIATSPFYEAPSARCRLSVPAFRDRIEAQPGSAANAGGT